MHLLHDYVVKQLAEKLNARKVVVWYDARREFTQFIAELRGGARTSIEAVPVIIAGLAALLAEYDGSMFELTLGKDSTFDWRFSQKQQQTPAAAATRQRDSDQNFLNPALKRVADSRGPQEFGGTYTIENNVLALQRKNGGSLIAEVTPRGDKDFNFKLLGGPADDAGLTFSR